MKFHYHILSAIMEEDKEATSVIVFLTISSFS